jgi:hypothetical protein
MSNPNYFYARPANPETVRVRDPETHQFLPACGAWLPKSCFWRRMLWRGEIVECLPPAPSAVVGVQSAPVSDSAIISKRPLKQAKIASVKEAK